MTEQEQIRELSTRLLQTEIIAGALFIGVVILALGMWRMANSDVAGMADFQSAAQRTVDHYYGTLASVIQSWRNLNEANAAARGPLAGPVAQQYARDSAVSFNRMMAAAQKSMESPPSATETPQPRSGVRLKDGVKEVVNG